MGLFDLSTNARERDDAFFTEAPGAGKYVNAASIKFFKNYLQQLSPGMHYHFSTGGQWSIHELIIFLFTITGPADVWKCTWAISEDPVRAMINLKNTGMIKTIRCIFNYKVMEQKSQAYLLAQQNFDHICLSAVHAKVTVIKNDKWCISVFGSQNDTRNPRIERGAICTVPEIAQEDINWMEAVMRNEKIFSVRKK